MIVNKRRDTVKGGKRKNKQRVDKSEKIGHVKE